MKRLLLALLVASGLFFANCATMAIVDGQPQNMGVITKVPDAIQGKDEIASYWQIGPLIYGYNLILNLSYEDFASKTKGKQYNILVKQYLPGFLAKVSAVAK